MNACRLDVFHHTADQHLARVVPDRVDVHLRGIVEESIDKHRTFGGETSLSTEASKGGQLRHRVLEGCAILHDLHGTPAEYVTRADEHGEPDSFGDQERLSKVNRGAARGLRYVERLAQFVPLCPVLSEVDRFRRCTSDEFRRDLAAELQWRLATEGDDHLGSDPATRTRLRGDHIEHVLARERLEIQPVARVVVRRHRLGVAVHHDRLEPRLPERE